MPAAGSFPAGSGVRAGSRFFQYSASFMARFGNSARSRYDALMAARATGSATISFGLVSIPVKLYTASSTSGIAFHMLHKTCGTRVKMQLYCPFDKEVVSRRDTVKGYEHAKDQFVRFEEDELRRLEAEKTDRLESSSSSPPAPSTGSTSPAPSTSAPRAAATAPTSCSRRRWSGWGGWRSAASIRTARRISSSSGPSRAGW